MQPSPSPSEPDAAGTAAIDIRRIAVMRLALAVAGLVIVWVDSPQPSRSEWGTYAVLAAYVVYSAALYAVAVWGRPFISDRWAHWADIAWYSLLISLSNGINSIFFFGLLLGIISASFRWGFASGLRTTLVSTAAFAILALVTGRGSESFELDRLLIRPVYLLAFGYMVAYWGGQEIALNRRLALLRDISASANPRFGVDRITALLLDRLRSHFKADTCLFVMEDAASGTNVLHRSGLSDGNRSAGEAVPAHWSAILMSLPQDSALIYNPPRGGILHWRREPERAALDLGSSSTVAVGSEAFEKLAMLFDAQATMTVPMRRMASSGRIFVAAHRRSFSTQDARFLLQVSDQFAGVVYNTRLVDRLASDAADAERRRIARNVHDSVIQPYIGLQMALAATRQKMEAAGNAAGAADLQRILDLSASGMTDLRDLVRELTGEGERQPSLLPSLQRFVARFTEATGIEVELHTGERWLVGDRLAAELFQIVAEGLSNIRRHTSATKASVTLEESGQNFTVRIENDDSTPQEWQGFVPRSITGRATALGGRATVEHVHDRTAVLVEIPL